MLTALICLAFITQGCLGSLYGDKYLWSGAVGAKTCPNMQWWKPYGRCGSGLGAAKLGAFVGGTCPSLRTSSFAAAKYLPHMRSTSSRFPLFKSYYKPKFFKVHHARVPIVQHKVKALLSKLPCLKKKLLFPGIAALPCVKGSCLKSSIWHSPCSPYSTFC